jgi:hypothetical protein
MTLLRWHHALVVMTLNATACSLPVLLQKSLVAIEAGAAAIAANNDVVSTRRTSPMAGTLTRRV